MSMLFFEQDFFNSETRDDFFIDSTMKTVWAAEMEVLAMVASICSKYQIPWFADWGTLLGTIRHGGYIPWDDDLDICLLRQDYDRLMRILPQELPEGWVIRNNTYGECCEQYFSCVLNASTISIERKRLEYFHGCPFVIGLDIFPLDYIPRDKNLRDTEVAIIDLIWRTVSKVKIEDKTEEDESEIQDAILCIQDATNTKIDMDGDLIMQLWRLANAVASSFGEEDADHVAMILDYFAKGFKYDKSWYEDAIYLPFENVQMAVPIGYEAILEVKYGDWRTPVRGTQSHDYPFFNKELVLLRSKLEEMEKSVDDDQETLDSQSE